MRDNSYEAGHRPKRRDNETAVGMDYSGFESGSIAFDYEGMLRSTGLDIDEIRRIQANTIGDTPLIELKNLTALARKFAPAGKGAQLLPEDEAQTPRGA